MIPRSQNYSKLLKIEDFELLGSKFCDPDKKWIKEMSESYGDEEEL